MHIRKSALALCHLNVTLCNPLSPCAIVCFVCRDSLLDAVKQQQSIFRDASGSRRKALGSQRFLVLLFYTALPPGRSKEYHTLHYQVHDGLPQPTVNPRQANCLHITEDGRQAYIILGDYKTHKAYGDHFLPLQEGQLLQHLAEHLNTHRPALAGPDSSTVLFLVIHCIPYTNKHIHT